MNILEERLHTLNQYMNLLESHDIEYFNEFSKENIEQINKMIDVIESMLSKMKLSDDKINEINLENKRQQIIYNKIFPSFWALRETIRQMNINELSDLE